MAGPHAETHWLPGVSGSTKPAPATGEAGSKPGPIARTPVAVGWNGIANSIPSLEGAAIAVFGAQTGFAPLLLWIGVGLPTPAPRICSLLDKTAIFVNQIYI